VRNDACYGAREIWVFLDGNGVRIGRRAMGAEQVAEYFAGAKGKGLCVDKSTNRGNERCENALRPARVGGASYTALCRWETKGALVEGTRPYTSGPKKEEKS